MKRCPFQRRALTLVELLAALALLSMVMGVVSAWTVGSARAQRAVSRSASSDAPLDRALRLLSRDIDQAPIPPLRRGAGDATPSVVFDAEHDRVLVVARRPLTPGAAAAAATRVEWRLGHSTDGVGVVVREETQLGPSQSEDVETRVALHGVAEFEIEGVKAPEQAPPGVRSLRARREAPKIVAYDVRVRLDGPDGAPVRTLRWEVVR